MTKSQRRADRFHFGFCNACERYACGESADQIRATPTLDAVISSSDDAWYVNAGVYAALTAVVDGDIDSALNTAKGFGLNQSLRDGMRELVLDA